MAPTSAFVAKYGCLTPRQRAAFRRDPDYPLLLSLEHYDEEADTARKAALFTAAHAEPASSNRARGRAGEALAASVQWRGRVDPAYMAELLEAPEAGLGGTGSAGQVFSPKDGNGRPPTTTCRAT
jgi:N12 class adenine-specific DNA methylase